MPKPSRCGGEDSHRPGPSEIEPADGAVAIEEFPDQIQLQDKLKFHLPKRSVGLTASCVTLHSPPPETKILAPIVFALSHTGLAHRHDFPDVSLEPLASASPAAPAPHNRQIPAFLLDRY